MKARAGAAWAWIGAAAVALPGVGARAQETMYALQGWQPASLVRLDPADGTVLGILPLVGDEEFVRALADDSDGTLYTIDLTQWSESDLLLAIDRFTGVTEVVGETGFDWNFSALAVEPKSGTLYGATDNGVFTVDRATGAAWLVAPISGAGFDQLTSFAINAQGRAFATDTVDAALYSVDLKTGNAERIGSLGGEWFFGLTFDAAGTLWGSRFPEGVYTIDAQTGAATLRWGGEYRGLAFVAEGGCYADFNADGALDLFDFLAFVAAFNAGGAAADCTGDGGLDLFDFSCFVNAFNAGC